MQYVSVDIESTGLRRRNPEDMDLVLSVAMVIDDLSKPLEVEEMPYVHIFNDVTEGNIHGSVYAFAMNGPTMKKIIELKKAGADKVRDFCYDGTEYLLKGADIPQVMVNFLRWHDMGEFTDGVLKHLNIGGKNVLDFDVQFLNNAVNLHRHVQFRRRALDPAILYLDPIGDKELPNMDTCLKRAGIRDKAAHDALEDARDVVRLIRKRIYLLADVNSQEEKEERTPLHAVA